MKVVKLESFIVHAPVRAGGVQDSVHAIANWGMPGVKLYGEDGSIGWGFTGTHAFLPADRAIAELIRSAYGPLIVGQDVEPGEATWTALHRYPPLLWVGRTGMMQMALAAVDIALWDLKAKMVGAPLWSLLGGRRDKKVRAYDTDGGWLNLEDEVLVEEACRKVEAGFGGIKIKVGSSEAGRDERRVRAVREAIGPGPTLMVDANASWDLPTAVQAGHYLAELGVRWLEEPLWAGDVDGHAKLSRAIVTPIALGEQLYTAEEFVQYMDAGAVQYVQPDAVRLGGITEFLRVAAMANIRHLPVVPHIGDMLPVHTHLAFAHPNVNELEYIPWILPLLEEDIEVVDGTYVAPRAAGAGTAFRDDAMSAFRVD